MDWTARYEELRHQTLEPTDRPFSAGCGLAVLLQRGIAAWIHALDDSATSLALPSRTALAIPDTSVSDLSDQWTRLLVEILFHGSREVYV